MPETPLESLTRAFQQEVDIEYASMGHAALTGLVAGSLQRLKGEQPIVLAVGHADPAGIPVRFNETTPSGKSRRYVVLVLPLEDE